jgi:SAM-dependent methyltransferase
MKEDFAYPGRELEAMAEARNYHRWILDVFEPYLGQHLVEVGAGLGSFSELILARHACRTLTVVEPSKSMYDSLAARVRQLNTPATRVQAMHGTFPAFAAQARTEVTPDSIIYVNVLEHIEDDEVELASLSQCLNPGGRAFLFVPALSWLYGKFDERVGHFRRYARSELQEKLQRASFRIIHLSYFDLPGVLPWWIKYRLLKSDTMEPEAVRFYDRFLVPAIRLIEMRIHPPVGKNIIAIAEKI